jgi:DNA-directed RNA polymerase omega subunit
VIYANFEDIYNKHREIENKYALAMIASIRARQLSMQKGSKFDGESSEKCITRAIEEIENNSITITTEHGADPED